MTEKTLDWLNLNSHRAYPLVNDEGIVVDGKRIPDCVLLDCTIMDTRHGIGTPDLVFRRIDVTATRTHVDFTYAGSDFGIDITGEGANGISVFDGVGGEFVHARFVFSSHDRILDEAGEGTWEFNGRVLPTKIATVEASGVMGLSTSGSAFVEGRELPGVATGDVHLVDGYRTQPVVHNGKVVVKVGNSYGFDPCHYYSGPLEAPSCDDIMLFFCGQNAVNSGNVILKGGPGVTVTQGRTYLAREDIMDTFGNVGIAAGERVPCIEVKASSELMRIYRPPKPEDSSSSSSPEDSSSSEEPITARSYVQDGLIAMWDGIENAGFGQRQTGSIVWKDLVGSHDLTTIAPSQYYWTDNSLHFDGQNPTLDHRGMECATISMAYFEIVAVKRGVDTSVFAQNGSRSANNLLLWQYYNLGSCLAHNGAAQRFPAGTIKKDVPLTMGVTVGTSTPELFVNGAKITPYSRADGWSVYNVFSLFANSLSRNAGYKNGAEKEIYNARCYSRFLTAAEIAANYEIDRIRFNLPSAT